MALSEIRFSFRINLSDTSREVSAQAALVALLHPEETLDRLFLRVIAWALWYTPTLRFGPGLAEPDSPTLFDEDLTGRRTAWIGANPASAEKLNYAVRHNHGALVGAAFAGRAAYDRFLEGSRTFKGLETVEFARVDEAFLEALAERLQERRDDLDLTIVEDTLYLNAGDQSFSGTFERFTGLPHADAHPARAS